MYWGLGTRENKIIWSLVVASVVVGAAFWIPGVLGVKRCINTRVQCSCESVDSKQWVCLDPALPAERQKASACYHAYIRCVHTPMVVWAVGWVFLGLLSWVPCCYFCCCARNPKDGPPPGYPQAGMQMGAVPAAGFPPYGQPVYAHPHVPYGVPAYGSAAPVPGAPVAAHPGGDTAALAAPAAHHQGPYGASAVPVHSY